MYRYTPPKSSVWGHKLGRMLPERQKCLFEEFLRRATVKYEIGLLSLSICVRCPGFEEEAVEMTRRFEQLMGLKAVNNHFFPKLDREQSDKCWQMLIANPSLVSDDKFVIILAENVSVTEWLIDGEPRPTQSLFLLQYGSLPCISTLLTFASLEEFRSIQQILADLHFCKLNEKHLKAVKARTRKK